MRVRARPSETSARLRRVMCKRSFTLRSVSTHGYNRGPGGAFLLVPRWLHFSPRKVLSSPPAIPRYAPAVPPSANGRSGAGLLPARRPRPPEFALVGCVPTRGEGLSPRCRVSLSATGRSSRRRKHDGRMREKPAAGGEGTVRCLRPPIGTPPRAGVHRSDGRLLDGHSAFRSRPNRSELRFRHGYFDDRPRGRPDPDRGRR